MEEQQNLKVAGSRKPPMAAFSIIEKEGKERPVWHKVGVAWVNRDGSINVQFDSLPLGGRVQLREERERVAPGDARPTGTQAEQRSAYGEGAP